MSGNGFALFIILVFFVSVAYNLSNQVNSPSSVSVSPSISPSVSGWSKHSLDSVDDCLGEFKANYHGDGFGIDAFLTHHIDGRAMCKVFWYENIAFYGDHLNEIVFDNGTLAKRWNNG